jgi:hypothetical protein
MHRRRQVSGIGAADVGDTSVPERDEMLGRASGLSDVVDQVRGKAVDGIAHPDDGYTESGEP